MDPNKPWEETFDPPLARAGWDWAETQVGATLPGNAVLGGGYGGNRFYVGHFQDQDGWWFVGAIVTDGNDRVVGCEYAHHGSAASAGRMWALIRV
jgi:hypothetical protein